MGDPKHGEIRWNESLGRTEYFHKNAGWVDGIDYFTSLPVDDSNDKNLTEKSCTHSEYVNSGFYSVIMTCKKCGKNKDECEKEKSSLADRLRDWILDNEEEEIL